MPTKKVSSSVSNPGMMLVITYLTLLVVNSLSLILANALFPTQVVLGTINIPYLWAILHSMSTLALLGTFAIPFIRDYENHRGKMFTNQEWMIAYFVINFVGVWLIARFSEQFGLGIRSWMVALVLAVVLDILQGVAMMQLEKRRTKNV